MIGIFLLMGGILVGCDTFSIYTNLENMNIQKEIYLRIPIEIVNNKESNLSFEVTVTACDSDNPYAGYNSFYI